MAGVKSTVTFNKPSEPVCLNVYDLLSAYRTTHCLITHCACHRFGVYHTSVQVYDVEYYYGDGICRCPPHSHVGRLISSRKVGMTNMTKEDIETQILFDMDDRFTRKDYDLLEHNCNHFTDCFLRRLLGINLPVRFNRTERCIGSTPFCIRTLKCMLGKNWTQQIRETRSTSNEEPQTCCHREARK